MLRQPSIKGLSQSTVDALPLKELRVELTEHKEESVQGGVVRDFLLSSGSSPFWGVRTTGGIWTVRWNPSSGKFSINYEWL
ncbi:hypothetical protein [Coleofasciculus sp. FACHB-1120]|uniref:hypothetical protein n=1 Tax=Coleofasciculus sp. FACHB-1120 TaxID=2692783 RepID=UPI001688CB9B|nr:hypothetical protein [Coleofasciculus sp. FACHB-1120]MBD2744718.1 hypothetical protein [Coleofasciculus sp. FACHB-1120]